jgi:hypothetical protein
MYKSILVHTYINKSSEGGQIGDDTRKSHPWLDIINLFNAFLKTEGLKPSLGSLPGFASSFMMSCSVASLLLKHILQVYAASEIIFASYQY